jgi:hypothetical protein
LITTRRSRVSAAPPAKRPTESDVDAVIEKIDAVLPKIYQQAEDAKKAGTTPSGGFSREKLARTRQAFTEMQEDSLLTQSGEDIRLNGEDAEAKPPLKSKVGGKVGGKVGVRHPASPARHKLYYRPSG